MKFGFFLGYANDFAQGQIVTNSEEMMMEDFMQQFNIEDSKEIIWLQPADKEYADAVKAAVVRACLIYLHGSDDPKVCSAARNTGLFGFHGPAVGHIGGNLNMPFAQFFWKLRRDLLPSIPDRLLPKPNGEVCSDCGRSFPEEDGFKGVICDDRKHRCFACYVKRQETSR